jgi:hypothetical protein
MKIRSKLAWTFVILAIIGINAICSYAIIYIKHYLQEESVKQLKQDTRSLAVAVSNMPSTPQFQKHFDEVTKTSGYQLALYDSAGALLYSYPASVKAATQLSTTQKGKIKTHRQDPWLPLQHEHGKKLIGYSYLPHSLNQVRYVRVSQFKSRIYAPVKKIRWIIYYGIFVSIVCLLS